MVGVGVAGGVVTVWLSLHAFSCHRLSSLLKICGGTVHTRLSHARLAYLRKGGGGGNMCSPHSSEKEKEKAASISPLTALTLTHTLCSLLCYSLSLFLYGVDRMEMDGQWRHTCMRALPALCASPASIHLSVSLTSLTSGIHSPCLFTLPFYLCPYILLDLQSVCPCRGEGIIHLKMRPKTTTTCHHLLCILTSPGGTGSV